MSARVARRFAAAIVLSLIAHAALVTGNFIRPPKTAPAPPPLEARLVVTPQPAAKPAAPKPLTPKPAAQKSAAKKPRAQPRERAPRAAKPAARRHPAARPSAPRPVPPPRAIALAEPEAAHAVESGPPAAPAPAPAPAPDAVAHPAPTDAVAAPLPRQGRITYELYYGMGDDRFNVGRTVQSWEVKDGNYRLGSFSETTGLADLFRSQRLTYLSEGKVTPRGLKPTKFLMSRTRKGRTEEALALFDWAAGTIALGKTGERHTTSLPAASQDIVSFVYQLGLAPPPPGRITLPITNGAHLERYAIDILAEENIETPLGTLRALPVKQVPHPGDESIEVWLAAAYHYLPVKIRFYDDAGNPAGEQVVSEIRVSDE